MLNPLFRLIIATLAALVFQWLAFRLGWKLGH